MASKGNKRWTSTPDVDLNTFVNTMVCCDLDLWPPKCKKVISKGYSEYILYVRDCLSSSWDIMVTRSVRTNGRTNAQKT